ncbi:hypothetical protein C2I19_19215 [Chromobacterium alticapitis]|uniref:Uncharacterized protein n=1 Tax=Chromobacterium alticapitis TaxID=2073169 RepID=A0A2S5DBP7_9NEIS|nr:hypothetical protein C2I19_19215 [Chromobacterium alticapitis]
MAFVNQPGLVASLLGRGARSGSAGWTLLTAGLGGSNAWLGAVSARLLGRGGILGGGVLLIVLVHDNLF